MAWQRETLAECVQQAETRIVSGLELSSPVLPVSMARVLARVVGAARHSLNGYISWAVKQIHPQTADEENLTLQAEADGVPRNKATFARYTTGTLAGTPGTAIAKGTKLKAPNGELYETLNAVTANEPLSVQALTIGTAGNQPTGTSLKFDPPLAGAGVSAVIAGGIDGTDLEKLEAHRARYLRARQAEKLGGHESEYVLWVTSVPGVTRAWAYPLAWGLGTVGIYFVRDGDPNITPGAAERSAVATAIKAKRPATDDLGPLVDGIPSYVKGPNALQVLNLAISGVPDPVKRSKIEAELGDLIWSKAEIGDGAERGKIYEGDIRDAIRRGSKSYTLLTLGDHVCDPEKLITMGTVTWS